jgi:hypothetical protein
VFPFSFEWIWDAGHVIFHGILWCVLITIGLGVTYCVLRALLDILSSQEQARD